MGTTLRGQLLARYLDAAELAAQAKDCHRVSASPVVHEILGNSEDAQDGSRGEESSSGEGHGWQDPDIVPTAELVGRQARILINLHKALEADPEAASGINEDLLRKRISDLGSISNSKFYAYRYDRLPAIWRQVYTDALILETYCYLLRPLLATHALDEELLDRVVEKLDRALITAGGGGRRQWLEGTLEVLERIWSPEVTGEDGRPSKRQRQDVQFDRTFSAAEPYGRPSLSPKRACPRYSGWTMDQFEEHMSSNGGAPWPIVFTDLIADWPALTDRPWKSPDYLLSRTFGGRRLVPVEVGRSYVDEGWGQELIQFRQFLARYVDDAPDPGSPTAAATGYLAQHNLFQQIPSLRNDIRVPDFCWVDVPRHPLSPAHDQPPVDVPQLNAWFGPARTITPLHTDGYHNLLCQAVGSKYLRLYPPGEERMRPRSPEHGVDMSNTSALDVGVLEGWDARPRGVSEEDVAGMRDGLEGVEYRECILEPGDTLVIPIGWWHYVRSLSVSFSVSFWWN